MLKYIRITSTQADGIAVDLTAYTPTATVYGGSVSATATKENAVAGIIKVSYDPVAGGNAKIVVDCGDSSLASGDRYREVDFEGEIQAQTDKLTNMAAVPSSGLVQANTVSMAGAELVRGGSIGTYVYLEQSLGTTQSIEVPGGRGVIAKDINDDPAGTAALAAAGLPVLESPETNPAVRLVQWLEQTPATLVEGGRVPAAAMDSNGLDPAGTAAIAAAELATAAALADAQAAIEAVPEGVAAMLLAAGLAQYVSGTSGPLQWTAKALELAPSGSGLNAQQTRDAMTLAPTAGDPAPGSIDADLLAIKAKTDLLFSGSVNVVISNPVLNGKDISLVQGDAYDMTTNQPVTFSDPGNWPSLAGKTVKFSISSTVGLTPIFSATCTVAAGPPQVVSVPITAAQSAMLSPGTPYVFDVRALMATNEPRTLIPASQATVNQPITTSFS